MYNQSVLKSPPKGLIIFLFWQKTPHPDRLDWWIPVKCNHELGMNWWRGLRKAALAWHNVTLSKDRVTQSLKNDEILHIWAEMLLWIPYRNAEYKEYFNSFQLLQSIPTPGIRLTRARVSTKTAENWLKSELKLDVTQQLKQKQRGKISNSPPKGIK